MYPGFSLKISLYILEGEGILVYLKNKLTDFVSIFLSKYLNFSNALSSDPNKKTLSLLLLLNP